MGVAFRSRSAAPSQEGVTAGMGTPEQIVGQMCADLLGKLGEGLPAKDAQGLVERQGPQPLPGALPGLPSHIAAAAKVPRLSVFFFFRNEKQGIRLTSKDRMGKSIFGFERFVYVHNCLRFSSTLSGFL